MRLMRKWLLPLVAVVLATTTIVFLQLWRQERERADALQAAHGVACVPGPEVSAAPSSFERTSVAAEITDSAASNATDGPAGDGQSDVSDEYRLLKDDTYREAYRKYRVSELARGHVDMTRVLGISRATADRLVALQVDREIEWLSVPRRNPRTEEELQARTLENERGRRDEDAAIGALIGDNNVGKWHAYQDSLRQRHEVRAIDRELALDGAPLRDEQVDALVGVMFAERQRVQDELEQFSAGLPPSGGMKAKMRGYESARQADLERAAEERIRAAAGRLLTPEQLSVFVETRRRWQEMNDAEMAMYRAADDVRRRMGEGN
jgi:hypothetical protein